MLEVVRPEHLPGNDRLAEPGSISEWAAKTNDVIDEAMYAGLVANHLVTFAAKMVRLELLKTKADLERGLSEFVLDCTACGMEVH